MNRVIKSLSACAITAALALTATPALAAPPPVPTSNGLCASSLSIPTPDAIACAGYYSGNILNGSPTDVTAQTNALASLGFAWNGNWSALANASNPYFVLDNDSSTSNPGLTNGNELDFGQLLFGTVIIGVHYGAGNSVVGNSSVFWEFNLTTPTQFITLDDVQGWSNAALYTTGTPPGVPEPATWAMMLMGFGAAGVAVRRSRRRKTLVSQLA